MHLTLLTVLLCDTLQRGEIHATDGADPLPHNFLLGGEEDIIGHLFPILLQHFYKTNKIIFRISAAVVKNVFLAVQSLHF